MPAMLLIVKLFYFYPQTSSLYLWLAAVSTETHTQGEKGWSSPEDKTQEKTESAQYIFSKKEKNPQRTSKTQHINFVKQQGVAMKAISFYWVKKVAPNHVFIP